MNVKEIRELVRLLAGTDVTELDLETEGMKITIKKGQPVQTIPVGPAGAYLPAASPAAFTSTPLANPPLPLETSAAPEERTLAPNQVLIAAPMVGTFYRAPSSEADPYVQTGEVVEPGQVVCIIEAMKLMNEIESEVAGRVAKILVENGKPVEFGQILFLMEPS